MSEWLERGDVPLAEELSPQELERASAADGRFRALLPHLQRVTGRLARGLPETISNVLEMFGQDRFELVDLAPLRPLSLRPRKSVEYGRAWALLAVALRIGRNDAVRIYDASVPTPMDSKALNVRRVVIERIDELYAPLPADPEGVGPRSPFFARLARYLSGLDITEVLTASGILPATEALERLWTPASEELRRALARLRTDDVVPGRMGASWSSEVPKAGPGRVLLVSGDPVTERVLRASSDGVTWLGAEGIEGALRILADSEVGAARLEGAFVVLRPAGAPAAALGRVLAVTEHGGGLRVAFRVAAPSGERRPMEVDLTGTDLEIALILP